MYSNELYHYGIPGQEWGKRNGPPYPLSEAKAAKVRMNSYNKDGRMYGTVSKDLLGKYPIESLSELRKRDKKTSIKQIRKEINHPEGEDLSGREFNCPNCAAAFEMVERGYDVCARPKQSGSNVENIESFFKGGKLEQTYTIKKDDLEDLDRKSKAWRDASDKEWEVKRQVESTPEWKALMDLYWNKVDKGLYSQKKWDKEYEKIVKPIKEAEEANWDAGDQHLDTWRKVQDEAIASTINTIKNQNDGARGIIVVGWEKDYTDLSKRTNSYHALNYKNENGTPVFYDSQSGREEKQNGRSTTDWLENVDPREIYIMRTDNLELSDEITKAVYSNRRK